MFYPDSEWILYVQELSSTILVAVSHAFRNLAITVNGDGRSYTQGKSAHSNWPEFLRLWCGALPVHHPFGSNRCPISANFVRP